MAKLKANNITTHVIAGFPGVGKSWLSDKLGDKVSDSDSSKFPKDGFPQNYINHIKSLIGVKKIILVSTHKPVLQALESEGIQYVLVHPGRDLKDEYLERYKKRGSPQAFIDLLNKNWDSFMNDIESANPKRRIVLKAGEYLKDGLK